jgi:tetratricopeptide (TPR) repeat protein
LASIGRFDDAIARIKRAQELDPFTLINYVIEAVILYTARQYDQAIEQLQKTLAIDPSFPSAHWILGRTYLKKSRFDDAIAEYQQAKALSGGTTIIMAELGYAYAASGRGREAQSVLDDLMQQSQHKHVSAYDIALIHAGLGQKDQAFEWLQKAYVERSHWLTWLKVEPLLDSLRENPKFIELLEKVGLEN